MSITALALAILRVLLGAAVASGREHQGLRGSSQGTQLHLVASWRSVESDIYGKKHCPCVGFDQIDGKVSMLNMTYPADAGAHCNAWEEDVDHHCVGHADKPKYCKQQWCFVDPCKCSIGTVPKLSATTATFQGRPLYYSYETCGAHDYWTHVDRLHVCHDQHSEDDCKSISKCAWDTLMKTCSGSEVIDIINTCKAPATKEDQGGLNSCRCVGFHNRQGHMKFPGGGTAPIDMGSECNDWEMQYHDDCKGDPSKMPEWCTQKWCYVDPCDCQMDSPPRVSGSLPEARFQGRRLYYSYATCGAKDSWTATHNLKACVMQKTEEQCSTMPEKCAWTGERCLGKELVTCTQWTKHDHEEEEDIAKADKKPKKDSKDERLDKSEKEESAKKVDKKEKEETDKSEKEKSAKKVIKKEKEETDESKKDEPAKKVAKKEKEETGAPSCPKVGCPATSYSVDLSGESVEFELACSECGAKVSKKCSAFQDERVAVGSVNFECADGEWKFESHTCGASIGSCLDTNFDVELEGRSTRFKLPLGANGSKKEQLGTTKKDNVWCEFECEKGSWELHGDTCADCPRTGCPTTAYTVVMGDHKEIFDVKCAIDGTKTQKPCKFEDKTYKEGALTFECKNGEWFYTAQTCSDEYEGKKQSFF